MRVRMGCPSWLYSSAPHRPPRALSSPNRRRTSSSMPARRRQQRMAVARKCGSVTAATAALVPYREASSGVSRLPMPKPTTLAVALEKTATARMAK